MKLSLRIETGTFAGKIFELTEGFFTLGRGERCNIRFDPLIERVMSKEHCYIECKPDGFYLTDNQSTNGTFLNGEKIQSVKLTSGDIIQFGKNGSKGFVQIEEIGNLSEQTHLIQNSPPPQSSYQDAASQETHFAPHFGAAQMPTEVQPLSQPTVFQPLPSPISSNQSDQPAFGLPPVTQMFHRQSVDFKNSLSGLGGAISDYQYQPQPEKSEIGKYIGIILGIILLLICFVLVTLITFLSVGPITAVVATVVAFTPVVIYILPFLLIDRYDPEPFWLMALAFAWGALVSVAFSFFANTIVGVSAAIAVNESFGDTVMAVVAAPIFEEASKGTGLLLLLVFFRKYFDDILDGIVFAGVIALGFATVENILYYGRAINGGGILGLSILFAIRGILSPFAHATFTSMTGIGCGISRETHSPSARFIFPVLGYIVAVSLHALWNGMAVFAGYLVKGFNIGWVCEMIALGGQLQGLCAFLLSYAFLQIPLFFGFLGFTIYVTRRQNKIINEMLAIDVARGLIPQEHFRRATSIFRSLGWLIEGMFTGKFSARNKYLRSIGKLGLTYWHIQRANEAQGQTASFQQNPILRDEVLKWREQV